MSDLYAGTIYRDLTDAHEAIDIAALLDGDLPPSRIAALSEMVKQIDAATRALHAAREKAVAEHRKLDDAQLARIGYGHDRP